VCEFEEMISACDSLQALIDMGTGDLGSRGHSRQGNQSLSLGSAQGLDVVDDVGDVLIGELAVVSLRHDRLEAGHDLGQRIND